MHISKPANILFLLAALLPSTLANIKDPKGHDLPGSCNERTNYPLESDFTRGYTHFCTEHLQRDGTHIAEEKPLTFTYELKAGNGQTIDWAFQIEVNDGGSGPVSSQAITNTTECLQRFGGMLEKPIEDKWYCVMDKTGGDAFAVKGDRRIGPETSGQGTVLVLGGTFKEPSPIGKFERFWWTARLKKGGRGGG